MEYLKLYLLETRGLGSFYVVAKDPTSAEKELLSRLSKADYGYLGSRVVIKITFLAEECKSGISDNYFSGEFNKLII